MSFHSRQADWHALQPMHFDTSMSFATEVSFFTGSGTDEADRRTRSASPKAIFGSLVFGLGSSNSNAMVPSPTPRDRTRSAQYRRGTPCIQAFRYWRHGHK